MTTLLLCAKDSLRGLFQFATVNCSQCIVRNKFSVWRDNDAFTEANVSLPVLSAADDKPKLDRESKCDLL